MLAVHGEPSKEATCASTVFILDFVYTRMVRNIDCVHAEELT